MKINFRYDSRDKIFQQKFGQAFEFPDELNLDTAIYDDVQPVGNVQCVAYTTCDIAEDQTNAVFDIDDLWARVPKTPQGSDPRDVLKEAVANGLLPKGKTVRLKNWKSFWRADLGNLDPFDNLRSAMMLVNSPIGCGTYWYREWHGTNILPIGKNPQNGHMYSIEGWKQINGEPHLIVEGWFGRKVYMPRETFNQAMKPYGMQTWVLSTSEIDARREKTLIETIKDLMINLIITLRDLIKTKNVVPVVPAPVEAPQPILEPVGSKLIEWGLAIKQYEGANPAWNNPGAVRSKSGSFLKFSTYEAGWNYLLDYLTRAATGKHKAYRPTMTLLEFQRVYSPSSDGNDPVRYADFVAKRIGVTVSTQIKNLV